MTSPPAMPPVSIMVAAYKSEATLTRCLKALLAQNYSEYEIIVVDSSPDSTPIDALQVAFPTVTIYHSAERLLPFAARIKAVQMAKYEHLLFTDADVYPPSDWLAQMVALHLHTQQPVTSALACFPDTVLAWGIHFNKFDLWLPGGPPRPVPIGPTTGLLLTVEHYQAVGGFDPQSTLGDTEIGWQVQAQGGQVWLATQAVANHHHITPFRAFWHERMTRGREFADLRHREGRWGRGKMLLWIGLLPLRWLKLNGRTGRAAARAGWLWRWVRSLPISAAGHLAWLLGESSGHWQAVWR